MSRRVLLAAALLGLAVLRCAPAGPAPSHLRVMAAASLADAFGELAGRFESRHPGVQVELDLGGSQQLATQLEQGAAADVFAAADPGWMSYARARGLVTGEPRLLAGNRLVVIVPRANPAGIRELPDLARHGIKLVLGAEAVPVGAYSRRMLANLAREPGFGDDYARRALANVVSEEENVKSVLGKVRLGEADAGIVYRSDVTPEMARFVRSLAVPETANVTAGYWIAVAARARRPDLARAFVELALAPEGQQTLERGGFLPASAARSR